MVLNWSAFMDLLPPWIRNSLGDIDHNAVRELRLRLGQAPQICGKGPPRWVGSGAVSPEDLSYIVNMASRYSAYAITTLSEGYITARGGHRLGICGTGIYRDGILAGQKDLRSICIRIARDIAGPAHGLYPQLGTGSVLIVGPPGSGKTTLLRDLIREISGAGVQIGVVDERCEIFAFSVGAEGFSAGPSTDVLSGVRKNEGIDMLLRGMGPSWIAVDEITCREDCVTLEQAGYCGVRFLATCHGHNLEDLYRRPIYRQLMRSGMFSKAICMKADQSFTLEELKQQ